jgi:hypothetical protein
MAVPISLRCHPEEGESPPRDLKNDNATRAVDEFPYGASTVGTSIQNENQNSPSASSPNADQHVPLISLLNAKRLCFDC